MYCTVPWSKTSPVLTNGFKARCSRSIGKKYKYGDIDMDFLLDNSDMNLRKKSIASFVSNLTLEWSRSRFNGRNCGNL